MQAKLWPSTSYPGDLAERASHRTTSMGYYPETQEHPSVLGIRQVIDRNGLDAIAALLYRQGCRQGYFSDPGLSSRVHQQSASWRALGL